MISGNYFPLILIEIVLHSIHETLNSLPEKQLRKCLYGG